MCIRDSIYENDLDYPAAKALSAEIVSARSFEPVDDALIEKAKELIDACEGVICDRTEFGTYEQFNSRLYEYAVSTGKDVYKRQDENVYKNVMDIFDTECSNRWYSVLFLFRKTGAYVEDTEKNGKNCGSICAASA